MQAVATPGLSFEPGYFVMGTAQLLDRARQAFAERAWQEAFDDFVEADGAASLEPTDLERCATAAYLTGNDTESTDAWARAHEVWRRRGDEQRAVRCAFWLGFALVQRGDIVQGSGWLDRAGRMVEEHELDTVERGYLLVPSGLMAMGAGEHETALERFVEVESLARRFGDQDLDSLGKLGRGQALLCLGCMPEGRRLFDEAMVSVTAGETSPVISGLVYCAVIDTCHRAFDLRRACEWTAALDRWCEQQPGLVPYRGQCLVHRAQVLQLRGEWDTAFAEVEQARQWLSDPPHPAVGMAHYQLGELHRLRGEIPLAEAAYRQAHAAGRDPQPGLALLRLAEGRVDHAAASVESALDAASDRMSRAQLLPAFTQIMLAIARVEAARAAAAELDDLAAGDDATLLGTIAHQTRALVLLAGGDAKAALAPLRHALQGWRDLDAPFEVAQVRVVLARACWLLDDHDRAELECDAARNVFVRLGAAPALEYLDRLLAAESRRAAQASASGADRPITERETQVLRLVAAGHTNRTIAHEMAISEKTVERHLGNIFAKLGVNNRTAATAHAYDHDLL